MEQNLDNYDFGLEDANEKILKKTSIKCNHASSHSSHLMTHLKTHKCNQCDYASSCPSNLRTHLEAHSGEKSNKCNQCDFASSRKIFGIEKVPVSVSKNFGITTSIGFGFEKFWYRKKVLVSVSEKNGSEKF